MRSSQKVVDQERQDQRRKTDMEDPATMTIEFLRARLLSERSVSRVAKQRADELAKRVAELEEQLKVVTLQRKKAEKATAEVLAILEKNESSDFSEALDTHNSLCETEDDNSSTKKEENPASSRPTINEVEGFSGSEVESSLSGRSLSWKSCSNSADSLKKQIDVDKGRRQCNFLFTYGSSTKPRTGKSCRQIKRRETLSEMDDGRNESFVPDAQGCSEDRPEIFNEASGKQEDQISAEGFVSGTLENQRKETNSGLDFNESGADANLERALEDQAQLIDQYEAEETAQREWERKFKENKSYTPDSSEHGNQSDITEDRDEIRKNAGPLDIVPYYGEEAQLEGCHIGETTTRILPNGSTPATYIGMGCSEDQQCYSCQVSKAETTSPEFSFKCQENLGSYIKGNQKQDLADRPTCVYSNPLPTKEVSPFNEANRLCNGESSGGQNRLQMAVRHEKSSPLVDVLEALQSAKSSLKHELNRMSPSRQTWPVIRMSETPLPAIKSGEDMDVPFGCAGLFRVPSDTQMETSTHTNLLGAHSDFGLSLINHRSDVEVTGTNFPMEAITQVSVFSACADPGFNVAKYHPSNPFLDMNLRNSTPKPYLNPWLDVGMALPVSAEYTCPSYTDMVPRMPSNGEQLGPFTGFRSQIPAGDRYSVVINEFRSKMLN